MSSIYTLLIVLVVLVSCVSAGSVSFYSAANCATQVGSTYTGTFAVNSATINCFAVTGVTSVGAVGVSCANVNGVVQSALITYPAGTSGTACSTSTANGVGSITTTSGCATLSPAPTGVVSAAINCNSAFSTQTLSIAVMVILAILAMIAM